MAVIRAFKGLRPVPELAARVASPPYDVLSLDEARALAADNPYSFLRVNRAELELPPGTDPYSEAVYQRAGENLQKFIADRVMIRDAIPCYYLYRLTLNGRSQTGLVALSSVRDYIGGIIKKHEHTRPEKVIDRVNHIVSTRAQVGPVLVAFRHDDEISATFARVAATSPAVEFTAADNVTHELWVIDSPETVGELSRRFATLGCTYIADGHHRSEAGAEACRRLAEGNRAHTGNEPYNFFLTVLYDDREMNILPYNRVITDLGDLSVDAFLDRLREGFRVTPAGEGPEPSCPEQFGMYLDGRWYELTANPGSWDAQDPVKSIGAAILSDTILGPVLGITDLRRDERIDFVGGIRGTEELKRLVDGGRYRLAFALCATTVEQLLRVADAGEVMPPKSTWFEPKLRSGMVVSLLDE